jgi:A nuclease of the HNH/ENDO VII superfamily with conserved WHH/SMI1 / KNR4 family (SUKH-1)
MTHRMIPGHRYAFRVIHPGSPLVRARYPHGILVNQYGFPQWRPYARATVTLPDPVPGLTLEEMRVVDVLTANELMAVRGDPLWDFTDDDYVRKTPPGWTWAHVAMAREVDLVPAELHSTYRHLGGVSTMPVDRNRRGLRVDAEPRPTGVHGLETIPDDLMVELERQLRLALPPRYRAYLAATNGGAPVHVGTLPGYGFVADQPLFGLGRDDLSQDLVRANGYLADRFTADFLAIGYVQGGMLAVRVAGDDTDSVWYWDDDDFRDDDGYSAQDVCARLLHRCADDIDAFWAALVNPARALLAVVAEWAAGGTARELRPEGAGGALPDDRRAPWQAPTVPLGDPLLALADLDPEPPAGPFVHDAGWPDRLT